MSERTGAVTFEQALLPLSWPTFLASYWTREMLRLPGHADKFASLLTWADLNAIIDHQPLGRRRLLLYKDGKRVPPVSYRTRDSDDDQAVDTAALSAALSAGSTLVLNGVDDMLPGLRDFAESLDSRLGGGTFTLLNLYAGWRTQRGFDLHWDDHEVVILQVAGRKHWTVYRPTLLHPVAKGSAPVPPPPPAWDGVLEQGDLLYLPRGWWHLARPLDEASLHLTVTTELPRGEHFLAWLADDHADLRDDVPMWGDGAARRAYLERVQRALSNVLTMTETEGTTSDAIARFQAARDAGLPLRRRMALPHVAPPQLSLSPATQIRLTRVRRLIVQPGADAAQASFMLDGARWDIAADIGPAVAALRPQPLTVDALGALIPVDARGVLLKLLAALALKGDVALVGSSGSESR